MDRAGPTRHKQHELLCVSSFCQERADLYVCRIVLNRISEYHSLARAVLHADEGGQQRQHQRMKNKGAIAPNVIRLFWLVGSQEVVTAESWV